MQDITITQAKIMFLESIKLPCSENTLQTYRKAMDTFSNMLATQKIDSSNFPVAELKESSIADFVDYMKEFSPATERLYLQVMKSFLKFLDAENLTRLNLSRVRMLIQKQARRTRRQSAEYPEEEVKQLIEFMNNPENFPVLDSEQLNNEGLRSARDRALILTLADTGLRVDEISKLRCGDIDWERNRAILKGRGNKQAVVRFSTRVINALRAYLSDRELVEPETGKPLSSLPLFARHDKGAGKKIKSVTPTTIRNIVTERAYQVLDRIPRRITIECNHNERTNFECP